MSSTVLQFTSQPAERVRDYLEREFLSQPARHAGRKARLPTAEQLASHLGVSTRTVQKVVAQLASEGMVKTVQGKGAFVCAPKSVEPRSLVVGTNMLAFKADHAPNWSETIYLGAVHMAAAMRRNLSVMPAASASASHSDREAMVFEELLSSVEQIDMLLLFGSKRSPELCRVYEEAGKPTVTINPQVMGATSDFVSADYFEAGYRVGRAFYEAGRRHFVYIAPQHFVVSQMMIRCGFTAGCRRDEDPEVRFTSFPSTPDNLLSPELREEVEALFTGSEPRPDAIFCMSDLMAEQIQIRLGELGIAVPDEVSILSGTGFPATSLINSGLTRIMQPMEEIGGQAIQMLCHRYDHQCQRVPGLYLPAPIHVGNTTRPEENRLLQSDGPDPAPH